MVEFFRSIIVLRIEIESEIKEVVRFIMDKILLFVVEESSNFELGN